jgi:hypothetical protein
MTSSGAAPVRELEGDDVYRASSRGPQLVRIPERAFAMIDGRGDPNTSTEYRDAHEALYSLSYTLKFALKKELGRSYCVGALEGLWWADDMTAFALEVKADWRWTMMMCQPDDATPERFARAQDDISRRKPLAALGSVRLERYTEGLSAQIMHIGPYSAEGPTIARLHAFIQASGGIFDGRRQKHHETYLSDPRRAAPGKWRTIIRQPFDSNQ